MPEYFFYFRYVFLTDWQNKLYWLNDDLIECRQVFQNRNFLLIFNTKLILKLMERNGFESAIKWARCINKYTARHTISVPAGNGQAGRAPDSRETNPSSSPDRGNFYSLH